MRFFRREKSGIDVRVSSVIVSVIFGLAAGAVGMLVMLAYFPVPSYAPTPEPAIPRMPFAPTDSSRVPSDMAVRELSRSLVALYGLEDVQGLILPADAVGAGVALTSDGWIVTHEAALDSARSSPDKRLAAKVENGIYRIAETVKDPFTGIVFMRVEGSNLPVASFGRSSGVEVGDALFAFDAGRGLIITDVTDYDDRPAADAASAVRSSEKAQKVFRLSGAAGMLPGSALLDSSGQVVAVYLGESALGPVAAPLDQFFPLVGEVLRDRQVVRPYLGVRFIDLSEYPESGGGLDRGAKLSSLGGAAAVMRRSPAALAGLRDGDIIVSVNDEAVTNNKSLPELIAEYGPGDTVALKVLRGGGEIAVSVVLERVP